MIGKKQSQEQAATTPPMARDPAAVGAGPGNQLQENDTQSENGAAPTTDVKPGAQPDGEASISKRDSRNEGVE